MIGSTITVMEGLMINRMKMIISITEMMVTKLVSRKENVQQGF